MEHDPTRHNPDGELVLPQAVITWIVCILAALAVVGAVQIFAAAHG